MEVKRAIWLVVQLAVVIAVVALLLGQVLGQPVLFSYVTSGSMEPALAPGDGFVAIPAEITGEPGQGDVVVFESEQIDGGGLTTHRIVDETDRGFVTKGDANPFTDQDSDEPPVQEAEVLAVAWQPGGDLLRIPKLGAAVTGIQTALESLQWTLAQLFGTDSLVGLQGTAYLVLIGSVILYALDVRLSDDRKRTRRIKRVSGVDTRVAMIVLTALVVAGATAAMVGPAENHEFGIVSAEFESESPDVIEQGTSESYRYEVVNSGVVPTVVVLEPASDNIGAEPRQLQLSGRDAKNTSVTITAPPETGYYRSYLQERRYLHLLPLPIIESLYDVHPWAPIAAINATVGIPFYLLGMTLVGSGRIRTRSRQSPSSYRKLVSRLR